MSLVWVPSKDLVLAGGPPPEGIRLEEWSGGEPPEGRDEVEFVVPPFGFTAQSGVLNGLPRLQVLQTVTAGVDWILPHVPPGVTLCDARGIHDASTAEWAMTAMLSVIREFPRFLRAQVEGRWDYGGTPELTGSTVLILGYGSIGAALERRLEPFDVTVLRVARRARDGVAEVGAIPELLPQADVVVLLVPLTPETRGLVDAEFLRRMKDGALLVNAARGPVVVTDALLAELQQGRLRAAVDVTDPEPLPEGHPLWSAPNLLLTPHVGGSTTLLAPRLTVFLGEQITRFARDEPLANVVEGGY